MQTERPDPVPLCDLRAQHQELREEIEAALSRVLTSGQVILGPETVAQVAATHRALLRIRVSLARVAVR